MCKTISTSESSNQSKPPIVPQAFKPITTQSASRLQIQTQKYQVQSDALLPTTLRCDKRS
jgi:hypothetical protein